MSGLRSQVFGLLGLLVLLAPACGGSGGGGGGGTGGAGGAAGASGASGGAGMGGSTGTGGGGGGQTSDGGAGPLSFVLDGVPLSAGTAAAQVGTGTGGMFLRVLGTSTTSSPAFSLNINLVGAAATTPGTYSCDPGSTGGSLVSFQETLTATSYTSFDSSCTVTVTAVGAVGAQVSGTFAGMVRNGAAAPRAITNGAFDVLRAQ
jgi:hypothetical protein